MLELKSPRNAANVHDAKDGSARGRWSLARDFAAGWCGGASGILASHPLDTARIRIQVGDTSAGSSIGTELSAMLRHEGVSSLGRGIATPLLTVGLWKAVIFSGMEKMHAQQDYGTYGRPTLLQLSIAGFVGGVAGAFIQTPLENVKLNAQVNRGPATLAYEWQVARDIVARRGWTGLYRGLPLCFLCSPTSYAAWFPLNELCLRLWRRSCVAPSHEPDSFVSTLVCGAFSGSASWCVAYPADKAKAIWSTTSGTSYFECFIPRLRAEGVRRFLFGGLYASVIRGIPQSAAIMFGYRLAQESLPGSARPLARV